jgi:hypothetical protein
MGTNANKGGMNSNMGTNANTKGGANSNMGGMKGNKNSM